MHKALEPEYRYRSRYTKTYFDTYVTGSAFWATRYDFAILWGACILWVVLFDYVIEENLEDAFGFGVIWFTVLFFYATFAGTIYLQVERQLFVDIVLEYDIINSNLKGMHMDVATIVSPKTSEQEQLKSDILELLNLAPLAYVDEHRHRDNAKYVLPSVAIPFAEPAQSSVRLDNNLCIESLPLGEHLKAELAHIDTNIADNFMFLVMRRVSELVRQKIISDRVWHRLSQTKESILEQSHRIKANRRIGITRIIKGIAVVSIYLWSFFIPWFMWGDFRLNTVWMYAVIVWPIVALLGAARVLEDPFTEYTTSDYAFMDLKLLSLESHREIRTLKPRSARKEHTLLEL